MLKSIAGIRLLAALYVLTCGLHTGSTSIAVAQTKWNLPAAYAIDNLHTENLVQFARDVEAGSAGKLQIVVHAGASLFKAPEIKRAVMGGQAQIGEVLISLHENEDPIFGVDVVPFLATSFADSSKLHRASKAALDKKLAAQGLLLLYAMPWPPQGIFARKELNSVDDLKGTKWRAYNPGTTRIAELVGAQAVTVQAAELPQALATGVVNAFITSGATGVDSKAWETMSYFYDTQAWLPKNIIFVNKAAFDALDKPSQEALLKAAAAAETRGWKISEERSAQYLETLKSKGMQVLPPGPRLTAGLKKLGEQLTADWLKKAGADGQALIEAYRK